MINSDHNPLLAPSYSVLIVNQRQQGTSLNPSMCTFLWFRPRLALPIQAHSCPGFRAALVIEPATRQGMVPLGVVILGLPVLAKFIHCY